MDDTIAVLRERAGDEVALLAVGSSSGHVPSLLG
jgi:hypothetical protein